MNTNKFDSRNELIEDRKHINQWLALGNTRNRGGFWKKNVKLKRKELADGSGRNTGHAMT